MPLWELPLFRGFGRKGEGWGDGQYVESGDDIVKYVAYYICDNQTKQNSNATWNIVLPVQFTNGEDLVTQDTKVLYMYTTAMMIKRKMLSELDEADLAKWGVDDEGWWITSHIGSVGINCKWLPAKLFCRADPRLSAERGDEFGRLNGVARLDTSSSALKAVKLYPHKQGECVHELMQQAFKDLTLHKVSGPIRTAAAGGDAC